MRQIVAVCLTIAAVLMGAWAHPVAGGPTFVAGVACNGPFNENTGDQQVSNNCHQGSALPFDASGIYESRAASSTAPGQIRLMAATDTLTFFTQSTGNYVAATQAWAVWTYDDFYLSGPPNGLPVLVGLNLEVSGILSPFTDFFDLDGGLQSTAAGNATFFIEIHIDTLPVGYGEATRSANNGVVSETFDGLLAGVLGSDHELEAEILTDFLYLPVNQFFSVEVYASVGARSGVRVVGTPDTQHDSTSVASGGLADFSATIQFPVGAPLFTTADGSLPAGYTVHSTSANVVDNRWITVTQVPEPSTPALTALGMWLAWRWRRRTACAAAKTVAH